MVGPADRVGGCSCPICPGLGNKCPGLFGAHTRIVATKAGGVIVHFGEAKTVTIVKMSRALGVESGKEVVG